MFLDICVLLDSHLWSVYDDLLTNHSKAFALFRSTKYKSPLFEEFLGYRQKGTGDFLASWAVFRKEEKSFWYAKTHGRYLYSVQPLSFSLPSKTFRDGRERARWPRQGTGPAGQHLLFAWEPSLHMGCSI